MSQHNLKEISKSFFVDPAYEAAFNKLGLTSIDAVFSFDAGKTLAKDNLAPHRCRLQFEVDSPSATLFLKRYENPPLLIQLKNWFLHKKRLTGAACDFEPAKKLADLGIKTPTIVAFGEKWGSLFEKRSFIITEKIPDADSLETKLPDCFTGSPTAKNFKLRRDFITCLASFVKKFHETNFRHRDLYFSHIFHGDKDGFYLIDLARTFKPMLLGRRFTIKDIAQLYYSAPGRYFSKTDRLRFYRIYISRRKLTAADRLFIRKVKKKASRIARHDMRHGRGTPFVSEAHVS